MRELSFHVFPPLWRRGVYEAIYRCREVERFLPKPISDKVLRRLVRAAYQGSIGTVASWKFLVIRDPKIKHRAICGIIGPNRSDAVRPDALDQAPVNLAVACDRRWIDALAAAREPFLGSKGFVACCAMHNVVLAACAEGIGVKWLDHVNLSAAAEILRLPGGMALAGYGVLGYVSRFSERPALEGARKEPLGFPGPVLFYDRWGNQSSTDDQMLDP